MRRLSIIDVAGGHQPLSNEDGTLWLVVQRRDLQLSASCARELEAQGHRFDRLRQRGRSSTSTTQYGDEFVDRLNGMFAFALWDARRRRLLLGRDRLGIKPLYVLPRRAAARCSPREAKALLACPA